MGRYDSPLSVAILFLGATVVSVGLIFLIDAENARRHPEITDKPQRMVQAAPVEKPRDVQPEIKDSTPELPLPSSNTESYNSILGFFGYKIKELFKRHHRSKRSLPYEADDYYDDPGGEGSPRALPLYQKAEVTRTDLLPSQLAPQNSNEKDSLRSHNFVPLPLLDSNPPPLIPPPTPPPSPVLSSSSSSAAATNNFHKVRHAMKKLNSGGLDLSMIERMLDSNPGRSQGSVGRDEVSPPGKVRYPPPPPPSPPLSYSSHNREVNEADPYLTKTVNKNSHKEKQEERGTRKRDSLPPTHSLVNRTHRYYNNQGNGEEQRRIFFKANPGLTELLNERTSWERGEENDEQRLDDESRNEQGKTNTPHLEKQSGVEDGATFTERSLESFSGDDSKGEGENYMGQLESSSAKGNGHKSNGNNNNKEERVRISNPGEVQGGEGSESVCFKTDDILVVVAITCCLNFAFVLVVWGCVRWFAVAGTGKDRDFQQLESEEAPEESLMFPEAEEHEDYCWGGPTHYLEYEPEDKISYYPQKPLPPEVTRENPLELNHNNQHQYFYQHETHGPHHHSRLNLNGKVIPYSRPPQTTTTTSNSAATATPQYTNPYPYYYISNGSEYYMTSTIPASSPNPSPLRKKKKRDKSNSRTESDNFQNPHQKVYEKNLKEFGLRFKRTNKEGNLLPFKGSLSMYCFENSPSHFSRGSPHSVSMEDLRFVSS